MPRLYRWRLWRWWLVASDDLGELDRLINSLIARHIDGQGVRSPSTGISSRLGILAITPLVRL